MPAKTPQDRRRKNLPWEFVIDGATYSLRPPKFGAMVDLSQASNEAKAIADLVESCTDEAGLTAIRDLDMQDAKDLFNDWMDSLGGSGKSSGSSD